MLTLNNSTNCSSGILEQDNNKQEKSTTNGLLPSTMNGGKDDFQPDLLGDISSPQKQNLSSLPSSSNDGDANQCHLIDTQTLHKEENKAEEKLMNE